MKIKSLSYRKKANYLNYSIWFAYWLLKLHINSFGAKLQFPVVLCALLELDYPLNMNFVTNIIYFLADMCIFQNSLIILY